MSEKAPLWLIEDHITGAKIASQELDREKTIQRLEKALALAKGEGKYEPVLPEVQEPDYSEN